MKGLTVSQAVSRRPKIERTLILGSARGSDKLSRMRPQDVLELLLLSLLWGAAYLLSLIHI
jgi:hypothetical protein